MFSPDRTNYRVSERVQRRSFRKTRNFMLRLTKAALSATKNGEFGLVSL